MEYKRLLIAHNNLLHSRELNDDGFTKKSLSYLECGLENTWSELSSVDRWIILELVISIVEGMLKHHNINDKK